VLHETIMGRKKYPVFVTLYRALTLFPSGINYVAYKTDLSDKSIVQTAIITLLDNIYQHFLPKERKNQ